MEGAVTPEEAAAEGTPAGITHVVETLCKAGGEFAYVLLAIDASPPCFYLDENLVHGEDDGSWPGWFQAGGGFTDRTLADLRADPPPQGVYDSLDRTGWE